MGTDEYEDKYQAWYSQLLNEKNNPDTPTGSELEAAADTLTRQQLSIAALEAELTQARAERDAARQALDAAKKEAADWKEEAIAMRARS